MLSWEGGVRGVGTIPIADRPSKQWSPTRNPVNPRGRTHLKQWHGWDLSTLELGGEQKFQTKLTSTPSISRDEQAVLELRHNNLNRKAHIFGVTDCFLALDPPPPGMGWPGTTTSGPPGAEEFLGFLAETY